LLKEIEDASFLTFIEGLVAAYCSVGGVKIKRGQQLSIMQASVIEPHAQKWFKKWPN
jgi:hypothetical protein